jgi:hypothetical protein
MLWPKGFENIKGLIRISKLNTDDALVTSLKIPKGYSEYQIEDKQFNGQKSEDTKGIIIIHISKTNNAMAKSLKIPKG